jgi:signal recognition particle subunit SRP54
MVGLHGSGKTTSSGKLARCSCKQGRTPLLVAADVYRPAAMDQLETLGKQLDLPVFVRKGRDGCFENRPRSAGFRPPEQPQHILIFDTAGRLQIDEPLVQELVRLRDLDPSRRKFCLCSTPPPARKPSTSPRISTRRCKSPGRS